MGLDDQLRQQIKQNLEGQEFRTIEYTDSTFEGSNPDNICNRGKTQKGVQIGLSWGLRHPTGLTQSKFTNRRVTSGIDDSTYLLP